MSTHEEEINGGQNDSCVNDVNNSDSVGEKEQMNNVYENHTDHSANDENQSVDVTAERKESSEKEANENKSDAEEKITNKTESDKSRNADKNSTSLKFFVGGIPPDCWEVDVTKYFARFGKVKEVQVMKDISTGRNRGFCFVTMNDKSSYETIFNTEHKIKNKKVEVRDMQEQNTKRKVFVGGINAIFTEEHLKEYFSKFGEVEKATIMKTEDNKPRGFGFVVFVDEKSAQEVLKNTSHEICDKYKVEVRAALNRPKYYGTLGNLPPVPYGSPATYPPMLNSSWGRGGPYASHSYASYGAGGYFVSPYSPGGPVGRGVGGAYPPYSPPHAGGIYSSYAPTNSYGPQRTSPILPRGRVSYRMSPY